MVVFCISAPKIWNSLPLHITITFHIHSAYPTLKPTPQCVLILSMQTSAPYKSFTYLLKIIIQNEYFKVLSINLHTFATSYNAMIHCSVLRRETIQTWFEHRSTSDWRCHSLQVCRDRCRRSTPRPTQYLHTIIIHHFHTYTVCKS